MKKKISLILLLLVVVLLMPNKVFGASEPFTGMEEYAWNVLISLEEYQNGNCNILVTKYYGVYEVFFIQKQDGLTFTYSEGNNSILKYGIREGQRISFNKAVIFNQYEIYSTGEFSKVRENITENEFINLNPYDCAYTNTDILNTNGTIFFLNPPPQKVVVQAVERVGEVELKQVTKEILAMLPLILSVLVSSLALRKGLSLL